MLLWKSWLCGLAITGMGISQSAVAQNQETGRANDRTRSNQQEESLSQQSSTDRTRTGDDSETWAEWFSAWWDSDENRQADSQDESDDQRSSRRVRNFMTRYDQNDDNRLTRSELPQQMRDGFKQLDRNSDNAIDRDELQQHAHRASQRMANSVVPVHVTYYWIVDANQGRIDLNDLQSAYALLRKIDEDSDGHISRSELRDRQKKVATHWINRTFERFDDNDDDKLSRSEVSGTSFTASFSRLDEDGNGMISRSELRSECKLNSSKMQDQEHASQASSEVHTGYRGTSAADHSTESQDRNDGATSNPSNRDQQRSRDSDRSDQ